MTPRDLRIARYLQKQGFVHPYRLVRAARRARIAIPTACALLSMETGNGRNVWGHDPVSTGGCYTKGGRVTERNYRCYRAKRRAGQAGMQGCGPTQLTWFAYQDRADKAGGCHHPFWNMTVGFSILREHWQRNGRDLRAAFRQYNGSGQAAERYADLAVTKRSEWQSKLRKAGFR